MPRWTTTGIDPRADDGLWGTPEEAPDFERIHAVACAYGRWYHEWQRFMAGEDKVSL